MSDRVIRVRTLVSIVISLVMLALCGLAGFIVGRETAPTPSYGKNSLEMAAGRWNFPGTLSDCEKRATTVLANITIPFVPVVGKRSLSSNQTQSMQLYNTRAGIETDKTIMPSGSAIIICDAEIKQMILVVADHIYYHRDMIADFENGLNQIDKAER